MTPAFGTSSGDASIVPEGCRSGRGPSGSVVLDKAWAERLGVQRVGGVYRISHRELTRRLASLRQAHLDRLAGSSTPPKEPTVAGLSGYPGILTRFGVKPNSNHIVAHGR